MPRHLWTYDETLMGERGGGTGTIVDGFSVEAIDGSIGTVDEATDEVNASYIVVDTGPWIFGKKVMIPAGLIERVDLDEERIFINQTKEQIRSAPELDEMRYHEPMYREDLSRYYGDIV
jgi:hypothetical protein